MQPLLTPDDDVEPPPSNSSETIEPQSLALSQREIETSQSAFLRRGELDELGRDFAEAREKLRGLKHAASSRRIAAEWLFDNSYLIERALWQLRHELPAGFQCSLPRLAEDKRARSLVVAEAIFDETTRELDLAEIEDFLQRYQEVTPLTIAELWALPALLRLVILRHFQRVLEAILVEARAKPAPFDVGTAAGRAVRALRLLAEIDWKDVFSQHSATEKLLRADPAGTYSQMDFETCDVYRRAIEELAFAAGKTEIDVTHAVLSCATEAVADGRHNHVGHWLIGPGRSTLERALGARPRGFARRLLAHPRFSFFGMLLVAQLGLLAPVVAYLLWLRASLPLLMSALALCWIPSSLPAATLVHWLISKRVRPHLLPKLDFSQGVPKRWRTLIAVPTFLDKVNEIDRLVDQLEVHYLGSPDPELRFALVTDDPDRRTRSGSEFAAGLAHAERGIQRLNDRYGGQGTGPFHLLHREVRWNPAEGRWMGWERKRGKLEELNRYLRGDRETSITVHVGDPAGLESIAFVITLDSDTQLPPGAAQRLIGTLAHPLNRPLCDHRGRVTSGYTVVQPRVEISPRSARCSPFSRLFSGDTGIDIYTRAVSEVYQDLFGEGIYVGKGIYDIDAFHKSLEDRVPENALVSHDLFEGIHGRAALVTDIVVYEDYPSHYLAYLRRVHRWIRGDWQLAPWLWPRVPRASGGTTKSNLSLLDRFKILDNLRRSLLAPALLALLASGWLGLPGHALAWTGAALLAPGAAAVWSIFQVRSRSRRELGRWFLALAFAPQEALIALDAIIRALVRMLWTHKLLLEWTTAGDAAKQLSGQGFWQYCRQLWVGPAVATCFTALLVVKAPTALASASPWLALWLVSPALAWRISRPTPEVREQLDEASKRGLRLVARRTWLFFDTFVGPRDHWLPPDHFQEQPRGRVAHRTSPTNIGMLLLSELAAYDLGYLGPEALASWISNTLDSVERLERHRGHIYNWYDTLTLEPLEPRYVSTVDSGNLAGALLAVAVGCERAVEDSPLRSALRLGLRDTASLLLETVEHWLGSHGGRAKLARERSKQLVDLLEQQTTWERELLEQASAHVRAIEAQLLQSLRAHGPITHDPELLRDLKIWLDSLAHQLADAQHAAATLLPEPFSFTQLGLHQIPAECETRLAATDEERREALEVAAKEASRLTTRLRAAAERARALARGMDFRFLYDSARRLFSVGFNVTTDRLDPHHYDLLASEARLASFIAIVHQQVPVRHWFALGRPIARGGTSGRVLLSWGGSMFEYLMPCLLMRSHQDTLLHQSCAVAVERQIAYGRQHDMPWGISESGYALLDGQDAYQYRSFGVPGLGLRRGLEEDRVITPYASVLALPFRPKAVVHNLEQLRSLGMLGRFGFFEAADYHPSRAPATGPALVHSYMAHHHGMSLVALDNILSDDIMVTRFHADARIRGGALLLDERVPAEIATETPPTEAEAIEVLPEPPSALHLWEPDARSRQVWALGNGTLRSFITSDGDGGSFWRHLAVTRWEPSPVVDHPGNVLYLRDDDTGELISITPEPAGDWPSDGRVHFDAAVITFRRRHRQLAIRTRITVAAGEDVEVREILLANEGDEPRRVSVIATVEPVLEPENQMARHPAFSKLFLRCSPLEQLSAVIVSRVSREETAMPLLLFRLIGDTDCSPRLLEIDRGAFVGRRGTMRAPAALAEGHDGPTGQTLDPLCACAVELQLAPGSSRSVTCLSAVAQTRVEVIELGRRFDSPTAINWAFEDAARAAAHRIERASVSPNLLPTIQQLLTGLWLPSASRRAPSDVLHAGRPSQRQLWGRGISGDEPIVLARINSSESTEFVQQLLAAHRYLRTLGIRADVVLVDEAASGYSEHGTMAIQRLLREHGSENLLHQRGGVHVVATDQAGEEELTDLLAAARVYLDARHGSLAEQLAVGHELPAELPRFTAAGPPPGAAPDPELVLEAPELALDNGFGGFDADEYVVRPEACPPAPWCNIMANEQFGCLVSESALGSSWSMNAGENRLTPWHNDPIGDPPAEVLYLRDEETARIWSTTPRPVGVPTLVRHGQGYTSYRSVVAGLDQTMTVFVPPELPVKLVRLRITNHSSRPRRLTATYYAEWVLSTRRADTRAYVLPDISTADSCLLAETPWSMDFAGRVAFLASDTSLHGYTTDRLEMLGRSGDLARPAALSRWGLSGRVAPGLEPCAALQVHVDIGPGETTELCFFLGQAEDRERALAIVRRLRDSGEVERQWSACRRYWERLLDAVRVKTPDPAFDRLCNRWLLYQSLSSRFFGRTAFYQSSGAYGFRDQLQDALAFLHCDPTLTRRHLLEAAQHQFSEGDVLHWWHPPSGAGVRTRCSDDLLWLVYATAEYVEATGDAAVLDETLAFLSAEPLRTGEDNRYGRYKQGEAASLLEHCRRALARGFTRGAHGLPLIGDGDWNDGMNRVGIGGRGESVWLGWFVFACAQRFATLLDRVGQGAEANSWRDRAEALRTSLAEHCWDGAWYLRAFYDDGAAIGSARGNPPNIDSIAQSWAVLSGAAQPERAAQALEAADQTLVDESERLVRLLAPPFDGHGPDPGYIAAYPPGIRENGGQYTHAAAWLGWAHASRGNADRAYRIFDLLNPLKRTRTREQVQRYVVEPYVIAADVYARPPWVGRGGWTWYTGAAAWTWRLGVEAILGLRRRSGSLEVRPCLPSSWPGFEAWVREGELRVHVVVKRQGPLGHDISRVRLDGEPIDEPMVELAGSGERRLELCVGTTQRSVQRDAQTQKAT